MSETELDPEAGAMVVVVVGFCFGNVVVLEVDPPTDLVVELVDVGAGPDVLVEEDWLVVGPAFAAGLGEFIPQLAASSITLANATARRTEKS
jgi:hypothetical protein